MKTLIGYTGFVGSNLEKQFKFDHLYNSVNIESAFGSRPDLLVYSGVRAEKFLANKDPNKDLDIIKNAINNIKRIDAKRLVLISTIDVFKNPINVDEDTKVDTIDLQPYGLNRYFLEKWIEENIKEYTIIRLPGLYGHNIKKNFIYDLINITPSMLTREKYEELYNINNFIKDFFIVQENGFFKCKDNMTLEETEAIKKYFISVKFSALNFTDSRAIFQFYNLGYLWKHIMIAIENKIKKLNIATEPVQISNLYRCIKNREFKNEISNIVVPNYNFKTKYAKLFNGTGEYIFNEDFVIEDIKGFVQRAMGQSNVIVT